jgi:hypothetical protein
MRAHAFILSLDYSKQMNGGAAEAAPALSDVLQVDRRDFALLAAFGVETDLLTFAKATESRNLNRGDVDENIFRAVIRLDEAVTLLRVEPFNRADR